MRKLSLILLWACLFVSAKSFSDSPHGKDLKISCDACHSSKGWKLDRTIYSFDHNKTALPLAGQHQTVDCKVCHPTLVFSEAKTGCVDCHTDMHYQTVGPDCARCHTPKSWIVEDITGIHRRSRFPLAGPHFTTDCSGCHPSASLLRFEPNGVECIDCHRKDYNSTTNPNHYQAGYSTNCLECHSVNSVTWGGTNINHSFFPLTMGHAINDCFRCHTNGNFTNTSNACASCHITDFNTSTNPPHKAANFQTTCADCHTTNPGWKPATFTIHNNYYALTGAHVTTDCNSCHNNNYSNIPNTCVGCHQSNYNQSTNPNHATANIPTTCADCHTTNPGWKPATFAIHNNYYPLTGGHLTTDCNSCHNNNYTNTLPTACVGCHQTTFNQTNNPNHTAANIPTTCADCHTTNPGWKPATFAIHNNYYPLTGGHLTTDCNSCHNNNYTNTLPTTCVGCHQSNYNQTTNPPHATINIPTTCADCHTTNPGWKPATFAIHNNYYPLTGAHLSTDCNSCHNNNYTNTLPSTCVGCHLSNYNQTTNPPHATINIPTTCADCHTTNPGWKPATFAIHNNYWPLTGAHLTTDCNSCHNNNYTNTLPTTCVSCHLTNYNQTNNPPHATINIPTTCGDCHTTNPGWSPATFPIHSNYYVLAGAHTTLDCSVCHGNNYNNILPTTCVGCHLNDYNQTNNPPHASAQYPTDCVMCHTQTAWIPSTFNHDAQYFPIYSGHHNGTWSTCGDCHTNSSNYQVFSCITCHAHNQTEMDNAHSGVSGYSYNSNACYQCHPTGSSGGKKIKSIKLKQQF